MSLFTTPPDGGPRRVGPPVDPSTVGAPLRPAGEKHLLPSARPQLSRPAQRRVVVLAAAFMALLVPNIATPLSANRPPRTGQTVRVVAGQPLEFAFTLSTNQVRAGTVTFLVQNAGRIPHDFEMRGKRTRAIPPGGQATLTVRFRKPGVYHYISTLPGQEVAGMLGYLVVTTPGGSVTPTRN
jgi:uncharacterized cupredoxin-like copper-binding protein